MKKVAVISLGLCMWLGTVRSATAEETSWLKRAKNSLTQGASSIVIAGEKRTAANAVKYALQPLGEALDMIPASPAAASSLPPERFGEFLEKLQAGYDSIDTYLMPGISFKNPRGLLAGVRSIHMELVRSQEGFKQIKQDVSLDQLGRLPVPFPGQSECLDKALLIDIKTLNAYLDGLDSESLTETIQQLRKKAQAKKPMMLWWLTRAAHKSQVQAFIATLIKELADTEKDLTEKVRKQLSTQRAKLQAAKPVDAAELAKVEAALQNLLEKPTSWCARK